MMTVLGGLAEFERELIIARTGEGRTRAKARGVKFGRPAALTPHQRREAMQRLAKGEAQADVARTASVIWVLNFGGLKWMLLAGGCVASFISAVALAEEFVEWDRHSEASPVKRLLLPPAS